MTGGRTIGLDGRCTAPSGRHYMTGIGALVRVPVEQLRMDRAVGLRTRGFVSGYPGSPLGGLDLELARRQALLDGQGIVHRPGINEELAATAVFGSQVATVTEGFEGDDVTFGEKEQTLGLILDQDAYQIPRIHRGLRSTAMDHVVFSKQEIRLAHFNKVVDRYLSAGDL